MIKVCSVECSTTSLANSQTFFLLILNRRSDLLLSRGRYSGVDVRRMFEGWVPNFHSCIIILGGKIWDVFLRLFDLSIFSIYLLNKG